MMAYLTPKMKRTKQNAEDEDSSKTFLLAKLRQSAEYKKYLRDHAEIVRTYTSEVRAVESRRAHRDTSPIEEW